MGMNKSFNPNIFKMGYVICYLNNFDWLGNLIVKRQLKEGFTEEQSQITHVEISGGGEYSVNIAPPLSQCIKITERHKGRYARLLRYKNNDYEKRGRYKVAYFSATLCNTGYDFFGVIRFVINWVKQRNRLYFCSEGCLESLQKVYPECLSNLYPSDCLPAHFVASDKFETVWEGIIKE